MLLESLNHGEYTKKKKKGHAQSTGRMGTVGMDREARAEMDTRGWHRAIGQLPNITDLFHNSLLTQLQPPLPPGSS